jgi:hypothetical protein
MATWFGEKPEDQGEAGTNEAEMPCLKRTGDTTLLGSKR